MNTKKKIICSKNDLRWSVDGKLLDVMNIWQVRKLMREIAFKRGDDHYRMTNEKYFHTSVVAALKPLSDGVGIEGGNQRLELNLTFSRSTTGGEHAFWTIQCVGFGCRARVLQNTDNSISKNAPRNFYGVLSSASINGRGALEHSRLSLHLTTGQRVSAFKTLQKNIGKLLDGGLQKLNDFPHAYHMADGNIGERTQQVLLDETVAKDVTIMLAPEKHDTYAKASIAYCNTETAYNLLAKASIVDTWILRYSSATRFYSGDFDKIIIPTISKTIRIPTSDDVTYGHHIIHSADVYETVSDFLVETECDWYYDVKTKDIVFFDAETYTLFKTVVS